MNASHLAALALALCLLPLPVRRADARAVCGLNRLTGESLGDWVVQGGIRTKWKSSLPDGNTVVFIKRALGLRENRDEVMTWGLAPAVWLVRGANNAYASGDIDAPGPNGTRFRGTAIYLDDEWLQALSSRTGNPAVRLTVIAHELGHVLHKDMWGTNNLTTWQQEYNADVFAGEAMCKWGVALQDAEQVFHFIAPEAGPENPKDHPTLSYRLRAIEQGYRNSGCGVPEVSPTAPTEASLLITVSYAARYPHGITFSVDGERHDFHPRETVTVRLRNPTATLAIWKCPGGQCGWASYRVTAGGRYAITEPRPLDLVLVGP